MIDYDNLPHNKLSEDIVSALKSKIGTRETSFFRIHVAYYFSVVAAMMRASYKIGEGNEEPVNLYAINLAPSGFGKGHSTMLLEDFVISGFRETFLNHTLPILTEQGLAKLAVDRARAKGTDPDTELERARADLERSGPLLFSFDSATSPAIKQLRHKLLLCNAASINLEIDEIGANLLQNKDVVNTFLELFNGKIKNKLIKNTPDSLRSEELRGTTPTNMLLFGEPNDLLDGAKNEEEFIAMLSRGYARRCFYGFVADLEQGKLSLPTPQERLAALKLGNVDKVLSNANIALERLADPINAHRCLVVPDDTLLLYYEYQNDCAIRAHEMVVTDELRKKEMKQRFFKAMKLAGAYAFIENSPEILTTHLLSAINVAEESGKCFDAILRRDRSYMKLAKHIAVMDEEVTQTDLVELLPFYRGSKAQKEEMMTQAIAWGYKNNILIKRRITDGIEFFRGETLKATDLDQIKIAYSADIAYNYLCQAVKWDDLYKLTQAPNMHWANHHFMHGHRSDSTCIPGFNIIVIDVDKGVSLEVAKSLLKGYKALFYTTKRHTPEHNRFRIILPTNYELSLDSGDFKEFMKNIFEWLPFESDAQTGQRSRKWLSNPGHYEYTDGELFDVLPFIPKTRKNELRKKKFDDLQSLDNLERWFIQTTADGNRNNLLLRYAYILVDAGFSKDQIREKVLSLNDKLPDKLDDTEIMSTIMVTISKAITARDNS